MKHFTEMNLDTLRATRRAMRDHRKTVIECYSETVTGSVTDTVESIVSRLGYETAVEAVAELVNASSLEDGRLSQKVRTWAANVETAATHEECRANEFYTPSEIHPCHVDQLAREIMNYTPKDPQEAAQNAQEAANISENTNTTEDTIEPQNAAETPVEVSKKEQGEMMMYRIKTRIELMKDRSAWSRGVNVYALELVDNLIESIECGYHDIDDIVSERLLDRALLNGADSWTQYSWGGCALVYDPDIAVRLCNPSELKKTRIGHRRPNSREEWLDTQSRALYQAALRIKTAAHDLIEEDRKIGIVY